MTTEQPKPSKNKSIDKSEYNVVSTLLRTLRTDVRPDFSQAALGEILGRPQTFISDVELGTRRLDALQLREWCQACGTSFTDFARRLDEALELLPQVSNEPPRDRPKRPRTAP